MSACHGKHVCASSPARWANRVPHWTVSGLNSARSPERVIDQLTERAIDAMSIPARQKRFQASTLGVAP